MYQSIVYRPDYVYSIMTKIVMDSALLCMCTTESVESFHHWC